MYNGAIASVAPTPASIVGPARGHVSGTRSRLTASASSFDGVSLRDLHLKRGVRSDGVAGRH